MAMAILAADRWRAPSAIAAATSRHTALLRFRRAGGTANIPSLRVFGISDKAAFHALLRRPERWTSSAARRPPVQDSAVTTACSLLRHPFQKARRKGFEIGILGHGSSVAEPRPSLSKQSSRPAPFNGTSCRWFRPIECSNVSKMLCETARFSSAKRGVRPSGRQGQGARRPERRDPTVGVEHCIRMRPAKLAL